MDRGSRRHLIRRPHASGYLRDDRHRHPRGITSGLVGLRPLHTPADLPSRTTHSLHLRKLRRRRCGVVTRSPASRRSSPATALPTRINRAAKGTTGILVTTGPIVSFLARPGASLEVSRPLQHTSAASRALAPKAAGLRTCPAAAFSARRIARARMPRTFTTGERFALAVFRCSARSYMRRVARSGGRVRAQSCDSAIHPRRSHDATERTEPCRLAGTVVCGPSRGCGR
jgi:hypothetical protein